MMPLIYRKVDRPSACSPKPNSLHQPVRQLRTPSVQHLNKLAEPAGCSAALHALP